MVPDFEIGTLSSTAQHSSLPTTLGMQEMAAEALHTISLESDAVLLRLVNRARMHDIGLASSTPAESIAATSS